MLIATATIILCPYQLNITTKLDFFSGRLRLMVEIESRLIYGDGMLQTGFLLIKAPQITCGIYPTRSRLAWSQSTEDPFFAQLLLFHC